MSTDVPAVPETGGLSIRVVRGGPDDDELAAAVAVLTDAYAEEAAVAEDDEPNRTTWELSRRSLRSPLRRDLGWPHGG